MSQVRTASGTELADRIDYGIVNCHVGTFAFVCGCHSSAGVRIRLAQCSNCKACYEPPSRA